MAPIQTFTLSPLSKTAKESSDCDARCAGGCLGTVIRSIHSLRCTKDTLGVHVVVNQTIGDIIRMVCLDCLNCDTIHSSNRVNGINQAAEVVSKVGAEKEEKEANGRLGPPPKR
jgi:hypothetical protein